jgi:hypothetical protein
VAQIKERAPATLRVLTRTVSREDFEINALRLTFIARALMVTSNEDPSVGENAGILYVVPVGGGAPTQAQKDAVLEMVTVTFPSTLTFTLEVLGTVFKAVNVFAIVYIRQGQSKAAAKASILEALAAFFAVQNADGTANTNVDYGANVRDDEGNITPEVALSDVFNLIRDVAGVRKIGAGVGDFTLNGEHDDVSLEPREFPSLGTVTLIDGDTGAPL